MELNVERDGDLLKAQLQYSLGSAHEERKRVELAGFEVDAEAVARETEMVAAAEQGRWGDVLVALCFCAVREPSVYCWAFQQVAFAIAAVQGALPDPAANMPPSPADGIALPWRFEAKVWSSPLGKATVLPTGHLRVEIANEYGRNTVVKLPITGGKPKP